MDLSAYSLQKLNREKRERQPNWTESEKQLLLNLTRMHRAILENKGSDTMTIKRKSEVWDEIALRMQAAGFNRSKERLKQQLGRIRAAEAKKVKDAMERNLSAEPGSGPNISFNNLIIKDNFNTHMMTQNNQEIQEHISTKSLTLTGQLQLTEDHCIKTENIPSADETEYSEEELSTNSKVHDNMNFMVKNVQSLAESNCIIATAHNTKSCTVNTSDVTSTVSCSTNSPKIINLIENPINDGVVSGNEENVISTVSNVNNQMQPQNRSNNFRILKRRKRIRKTLTRDKSLRQLYMYRIAVERERLRNLKLQQKRDRILYRKDVEIQNLKLQILHNLTNQNREANRINL
ncbi:uncharacterized protein LOC124419551 isoform X2 [Lucilia cuprina]|uniref:uncharacterized protein LOC124419551 isoform X2 n=1 Tax=Lucilia cuprina TaxID=7375 RepID=UPI001F06916D|nr:uncharacterized protein LOC124419551 isoform X2 [Lucilia cuprina]